MRYYFKHKTSRIQLVIFGCLRNYWLDLDTTLEPPKRQAMTSTTVVTMTMTATSSTSSTTYPDGELVYLLKLICLWQMWLDSLKLT